MHSFLHNTERVSQLCCSAECKDMCASVRDTIVSFMDHRIPAGVCKPIYFFPQTSLASNNLNNVMVINQYDWCVSQKEMKRFVLITVPSQFPDDDVEIRGSTGPSYGIQDTRALRPGVMVRIKHKDRFICRVMKKIYQAYVHKDVGHTNGRAI